MDIAIYGAGSLGTVLGAYLAKAGAAVELISRNEAHVTGLREKGARIVGTVDMAVPVTALRPSEMAKAYDIIFLLTKQLENDSVVPGLASFLKPDGALCTMQNGLPEYGIAKAIGAERTFGCAVAWGATLLGEGVAELTSDPAHMSFSLGAWAPDVADRGGAAGSPGERLERIRGALELMCPVEIEPDFAGARWSKLLINAAFSGMSAITGATFGEVAQDRRSRPWVQRIMKEVIDIARAEGVRLAPVQGKDIVRLFDYRGPLKKAVSYALIPLAMRRHAKIKASILQDLEKGKPTEIDYINGAVSGFGRKTGVPTPVDDLVVKIVHRMESGELEPGWENLRLFEAGAVA